MEPEFNVIYLSDGRIVVQGRLHGHFMQLEIDRNERDAANVIEDIKQYMRRDLRRMAQQAVRNYAQRYGAPFYHVRDPHEPQFFNLDVQPSVSAVELAAWDEYDQQED